MANLSNWEDSLDEGLVNRLHRPLRKPGMMKMAMGQRIINRCDRFLNRLPLLTQQMQRWGNTNSLSSESIPIVYAQPVTLAKEQEVENRVSNYPPSVSQVESSVNIIQRKLDSSQSLPTRTVNNNIPVQNITQFSNSDFVDETTQSLNLETQINKNSISSSELPVVLTQPIAEELPKTAEMALRDSTDSQASLPHSAESNLNHPSQPIADATSIISSEIPVVSPQPIAEELPKTAEMALRDSTDSQASLPHSAESNLNFPSQPIVDVASIFSSQIPVVSPQSIAEQFPHPREIPSSQEFTSFTDATLPIIQAKLQNSSKPQPSLPIVNNLNNLADKKTQVYNYVSNLSLIKQESKELPIVTAQPLSPQINLTQQEISFPTNSLSSQNQPATFLNTQPVTVSTSQINQINHKQNITPLPLVSVTSASNPSLKAQSLPLPGAKNTPSSKSNSQQSKLSNGNSIPNTDSSSPPITFASSASPIETSVSPIGTQSNIDVNAIASQVERKLMRRLVIESERRGKNQWH